MTISLAASNANGEVPRPKDVGVLAMEVYFPRRVRVLAEYRVFRCILTSSPSSVSLSQIWKTSTACPRASTRSVSVRSTWPGLMTAKTSTPSLSMVCPLLSARRF